MAVLSLTWKSPYVDKTVFILRRGPEDRSHDGVGRLARGITLGEQQMDHQDTSTEYHVYKYRTMFCIQGAMICQKLHLQVNFKGQIP